MEDKIWIIIIWEKSEHPVHEMRRFLIPGERERNPRFESLIIVERVRSD